MSDSGIQTVTTRTLTRTRANSRNNLDDIPIATPLLVRDQTFVDFSIEYTLSPVFFVNFEKTIFLFLMKTSLST